MGGHSNHFDEDLIAQNPFYREMPLYGWFLISLSFFGLVMLFGYFWQWMTDYLDKYEQEQETKRAREARIARSGEIVGEETRYSYNTEFEY